MNYKGRKEWINSKLKKLYQDLADLNSAIDYSDPGIYYETVREGQQIEWRIQDLIHELEEMPDEELPS